MAGVLVALAAVLTASCSGGTLPLDAPTDDGTPADPGLVAMLREVVARELILPIAPAPTYRPELVELGQALFFDKELSGNRDVSCATCHLPSAAGGDARTLPRGVGGLGLGAARLGGAIVPRNSPSVLNAHLFDVLFWDGRVEVRQDGVLVTPAGAALDADMRAVFEPGLEALAAQAMFPPTSRHEMRGAAGENELADVDDADLVGIWSAVTARLVAFPAYVDLFAAAYPGTPTADLTMAHVGNAIAAFEATAFHRVDSPFQAFLLGDDTALSDAQVRGALEFFGPRARCSECHEGSTFTDLRFHGIGMPQLGPGKGHGPLGDDDHGLEGVTGRTQDRYRFRTPTLLNVELTAPYGHAGQFSTLESMVRHYRDVEDSLEDYRITDHVTDPELVGTQVANQAGVVAALSDRVDQRLPFDDGEMTAFMRALTAEGARDLGSIAPQSVPSGLSVDR
ncbi:MAG: cytochrome c peroxidase [Planctomycetota bacterium]